MKLSFKKISIIGMGLMGTSLAWAIKSLGLKQVCVTAITRDNDKAQELRNLGCADEVVTDLSEGIQHSDLIVLAGTLDSFKRTAQNIVKHQTLSDLIVIDLGSVKTNVIAEIQPIFNEKNIEYIPCHPMTGSEKNGHEWARKDLYKNKICIITPLKTSSVDAINKIQELWDLLGVSTLSLSPEDHDRAIAHLSHMPHLLSVALVNSLYERPMTAGGASWMSFARLAQSSSLLWSEIVDRNSQDILCSLDEFISELKKMKNFIVNKDKEKIKEYFERAKTTLQS